MVAEAAMFRAVGEMLALGIATSLHPCPLAAGVAALAFLARCAGSPRRVLAAGLLYAVGGAIAYGALAAIVLAGVRASPLAWLLHRWVHQAFGPILILLGMLFLGWIRLPRLGVGFGGKFPSRIERLGVWAALPLGVLAALSFCPASAAVFFGSVLCMAGEQIAHWRCPWPTASARCCRSCFARACWPSGRRRSARPGSVRADRLLGTADRRDGADPRGRLFLPAGPLGRVCGDVTPEEGKGLGIREERSCALGLIEFRVARATLRPGRPRKLRKTQRRKKLGVSPHFSPECATACPKQCVSNPLRLPLLAASSGTLSCYVSSW